MQFSIVKIVLDHQRGNRGFRLKDLRIVLKNTKQSSNWEGVLLNKELRPHSSQQWLHEFFFFCLLKCLSNFQLQSEQLLHGEIKSSKVDLKYFEYGCLYDFVQISGSFMFTAAYLRCLGVQIIVLSK